MTRSVKRLRPNGKGTRVLQRRKQHAATWVCNARCKVVTE
jgi:hypothetical protein